MTGAQQWVEVFAAEAGRRLNKSRNTMWKWRSLGLVATIARPGRRIVFIIAPCQHGWRPVTPEEYKAAGIR